MLILKRFVLCYSKLIQSTATGCSPVRMVFKLWTPLGALRTLVLISAHCPVGFTDRTAIVTPLSPIVCKVIVPPFSERTRALSRFTGAVPKSTLLYTAHVSVLWNKSAIPGMCLSGPGSLWTLRKAYCRVAVKLDFAACISHAHSTQGWLHFFDSTVCVEEK